MSPTVSFDVIAQVLGDLSAHGQALGSRLQPDGIFILNGLGVIVISWQLITGLLKENGPREILAEILPISLKIGILSWVINDYIWVSSQILMGFDVVSAHLIGAQDSSGSFQAVMASIAMTAQNLWDSFGTASNEIGIWDVVKAISNGPTFWLKLFLLGVTLLQGAIIGCFFILSQCLAGVALALGPIFLPWHIIPTFSFLSDSWLRYLTSACLMKVVGVIILGFIQSTTAVLMAASKTYADQNAAIFDVVGTVVILTISLVTIYLSFQIPMISQGLVSGSASVNTPTPSGALRSASQIANLRRPSVPKPPTPGGKPT